MAGGKARLTCAWYRCERELSEDVESIIWGQFHLPYCSLSHSQADEAKAEALETCA